MSKKKTERKMKGNKSHNDRGKTEPQNDPYEDDREEVVSKEVCPYCGKVFAELDADGCMIRDFGRCKDTIGEGDDGDYYFKRGFEILDEIWGLYGEIEACEELYAYFQHLIEVNFYTCGSLADLTLSGFLDAFPEVTISEHIWFGGAPGCSGNYAYITVHRKSQARLLNKLADIRDRLETFVKAGSFADEIQAQLESPKK